MNFTPAQNIKEVLTALDLIISDCKQQNSRMGYFAVLYKKMTEGVRVGLSQNYFDDGARMEKLDVVFANRYLNAYHQYRHGQPSTHSWAEAFNAAQRSDLIVVQHLLLGINAHINLDLGIAAAETSEGGNLEALQSDFERINVIISNVYAASQTQLKKLSWPTLFLGQLDPGLEQNLLNFSIKKARDLAWNNAVLLTAAGQSNLQPLTETTDGIIAKVAHRIQNPSRLTKALVAGIRFFESEEVGKNMKILEESSR